MLFAVIGRFRPGIEAEREKAHEDFNVHMAQRGARIRLGGSLMDPDGDDRTGVLFLMESDDVEQVRRFLEASPYVRAGLYEWTELQRIDVEVGSLG